MPQGSRRRRAGVATAVLLVLALGLPGIEAGPADAAPAKDVKQPAIAAIVRKAMKTDHLRAVIVKVTKGKKVIANQAFGPSMNAVPATTDMYFRNGAVSFAYVSNLLLQYVDAKKVTLDDTIDRWLPDLPEADQVTLKMLTNQTSGYPDYETDPAWLAAWAADPFHIWTYDERIKYAFDRPVQFAPGTNWSYAHTNFMILGKILSLIGKQPLSVLLQKKVLDPMGLHHTTESVTSSVPNPPLHAFSSERKPGASYEEATFWNTQWGTPMGANETTNIDDMATTAVKIGTGALLSKQSYRAMTASSLLGFGHKEPACEPSCFTQVPIYNYGLGIVRTGDWIMQDPQLSGQSATEAYLPSEKIAVAVAVTYEPEAFDSQGNYANGSYEVFQDLGGYLSPKHPPPTTP